MGGYPEIKYYGWDFTELHAAFNIPYWDDMKLESGPDGDSIMLKNYLAGVIGASRYHYSGKDFVLIYTAKQIRRYLAALVKASREHHPDDCLLWGAMLNYKDDMNLVWIFRENCAGAWT